MVYTQGKTKWWRRPWVLPLGFVVVLFVAFSLPPYLTGDRAQSRVPDPGYAWYYPALVGHVVFATVAILTAVLQIWPWFRRKYPTWHRRAGRAYVFAGVLPAGVLALAIGVVSPFGPVNALGNVLMAGLWLGCTVTAYRMARQKRFVEHRRWVLRSATLTFSIITNRFWAVGMIFALPPLKDSTFGGSEVALAQATSAISAWMGWVLPFLFIEWWLERDVVRKRKVQRPTGEPRVAVSNASS